MRKMSNSLRDSQSTAHRIKGNLETHKDTLFCSCSYYTHTWLGLDRFGEYEKDMRKKLTKASNAKWLWIGFNSRWKIDKKKPGIDWKKDKKWERESTLDGLRFYIWIPVSQNFGRISSGYLMTNKLRKLSYFNSYTLIILKYECRQGRMVFDTQKNTTQAKYMFWMYCVDLILTEKKLCKMNKILKLK